MKYIQSIICMVFGSSRSRLADLKDKLGEASLNYWLNIRGYENGSYARPNANPPTVERTKSKERAEPDMMMTLLGEWGNFQPH